MFKVLWGIDVIVALVAVFFFVWGVFDGSVSSFNIVLWTVLLAAIAAVVLGSRALFSRGHRGMATALAILPALPALGFAVLVVVMVTSGTKWN